jgi:hypothetical protein
MKTKIAFALMFVTLLAEAHNAAAFSTDTKTYNKPDGSARYSDDDDSGPIGFTSTESENPVVQEKINNRN